MRLIFKIIIYILAFNLAYISTGQCKDFYMELRDIVNRKTNRILVGKGRIKIVSPRETKIVHLDKKKVAFINEANGTYNERSFLDLSSIERIQKKYNKNSTLFEPKINKNTIKILSSKTVKLKNKHQNATIIRYRPNMNSAVRTTLTLHSLAVKNAFSQITANPVLVKFLLNYWSAEELKLVEMGYLPFRTSKLFNLESFQEKNLTLAQLSVPGKYKKTGGGDYYREMAIQMVRDGYRK